MQKDATQVYGIQEKRQGNKQNSKKKKKKENFNKKKQLQLKLYLGTLESLRGL